jgi:hypothetical protein
MGRGAGVPLVFFLVLLVFGGRGRAVFRCRVHVCVALGVGCGLAFRRAVGRVLLWTAHICIDKHRGSWRLISPLRFKFIFSLALADLLLAGWEAIELSKCGEEKKTPRVP